MATIRTAIELEDRLSGVLNGVLNSVNITVSAIEKMNGSLNKPIEGSYFKEIRDSIAQTSVEMENLNDIIQNERLPINDNTKHQKIFNTELQNGVSRAGKMAGMLRKAVGVYAGITGVKKAVGFIEDCFEAYNIQLNAENQLLGVLENNFQNIFTEYEFSVTADTSEASSKIGEIENNIETITIMPYVKTAAVNAAFDRITAKASEIQGKGIYGNEAMIAAAAEFSTYFTDTGAIEKMMDTLSNYVMGMEDGVTAVDSHSMVNYATNLGKIMTGAYDAMTKKGFQLTDVQKAIIEGTATQEQIVSALGGEYLDMSQDMRAAAAISQVIEESWGGLYENMSSTAAGALQQLKNDWGDLMEKVGERFAPIILNIVNIIRNNWGKIEKIIQSITNVLNVMSVILVFIIECAFSIAEAIIDNWSMVEFTILAVAAAIFVTTAAQHGLNAAFSACPIFWIIAAFIVLTTVVDKIARSFDKTSDSMVSAMNDTTEAIDDTASSIDDMGTSISTLDQKYRNLTSGAAYVCGSIGGVAAFVVNLIGAAWNLILDTGKNIYNFFADIINDAADIFTDFTGGIGRSVTGLVNWVYFVLQSIASAFDMLFGSSLGFELADWWQNERDRLQKWSEETYGVGIEVVEKITEEDLKKYKLKKIDPQDWFNEAAAFGAKINEAFNGTDFGGNIYNYDDVNKLLEEINANTAQAADSLSMTDEELKYLRDIAERETINRFTTAEINFDMSGMQNIVNNDNDIDGIITRLTDEVTEAVFNVTEGVHT